MMLLRERLQYVYILIVRMLALLGKIRSHSSLKTSSINITVRIWVILSEYNAYFLFNGSK